MRKEGAIISFPDQTLYQRRDMILECITDHNPTDNDCVFHFHASPPFSAKRDIKRRQILSAECHTHTHSQTHTP
jgi:hypothetical protein